MALINFANPRGDGEDFLSTSFDFHLFTQKPCFVFSIDSIMWLLSHGAEYNMGNIFWVSHILQLISLAFRQVKY